MILFGRVQIPIPFVRLRAAAIRLSRKVVALKKGEPGSSAKVRLARLTLDRSIIRSSGSRLWFWDQL